MSEDKPKGDPRVFWILNLILSFIFAYTVLLGLEFLVDFEYDWITIILLTVIVMIISHLMVD